MNHYTVCLSAAFDKQQYVHGSTSYIIWLHREYGPPGRLSRNSRLSFDPCLAAWMIKGPTFPTRRSVTDVGIPWIEYLFLTLLLLISFAC